MYCPSTSIIVVNWNGGKYLPECLRSLKDQTFADFEVILVDNGSTDESIEYVRSHFQGFVQVIQNDKNVGFARANNQGIAVASGKYIGLLNNDAKADREMVGGTGQSGRKTCEGRDARVKNLPSGKTQSYR